ncbi:Hypothetical protein IALB_0265 [Ignavibacterium album JCM 16511]|uniref:DUF2202 domain-containing protein n=1 Tax=Ignavibacterium album (strain DSM 19864 / JCM 16511 / NBRC 101810 / Mat9-16) TaxID=945713 RepID=I0AG70_IGNAJ|nr:DUF2202 domain-containing protein [Ignavibacterium album]AFH47977.1 Hypothetical protein IALB_0265 [Ignavibacterium album JCM 16511]
MKTVKNSLAILIFVSFLFFFGCNTESNITSPDTSTAISKANFTAGLQPELVVFDLSPEERDGLIHMRLEEKLARDVYTTLGNTWNYKVFLNIKVSEQAHMEAVKRLLVKYGVEDPITNDEVGVFSDPQFQALYDQFITQGSISAYEAFMVGKTIEELDIADLDNQLNNIVDNPDIIRVYQNLKTASESHLAAFNKCLSGIPQIRVAN